MIWMVTLLRLTNAGFHLRLSKKIQRCIEGLLLLIPKVTRFNLPNSRAKTIGHNASTNGQQGVVPNAVLCGFFRTDLDHLFAGCHLIHRQAAQVNFNVKS